MRQEVLVWSWWLVGAAYGWDHLGSVHDGPVVLEVGPDDAPGTPPGALRDAVLAAAEAWSADACLERLDLSVIDGDLTAAAADERDVVVVDPVALDPMVTYQTTSGVLFERFDESYLEIVDADIVVGPADWDLDDEVATGVCDGEPLSLTVARNVGFALGLDLPTDTTADSIHNLPDCSLPVIGADDRAGLRALYGFGVSNSCGRRDPDVNVTILNYGPMDPQSLCSVETFGDSPVLDLWFELDGARAELDGFEIGDLGPHDLVACAEFEAPAGCAEPVVCEPWPYDLFVCEPELDLAFTVELEEETGWITLTDETVISDPTCGVFREWSVRKLNQAEAEVLDADDPVVAYELPKRGKYEVTLSHSSRWTEVQEVDWSKPEDTGAPPAETGDTADTGVEGDGKSGCSCASGASAAYGWALLIAVAGARRRR